LIGLDLITVVQGSYKTAQVANGHLCPGNNSAFDQNSAVFYHPQDSLQFNEIREHFWRSLGIQSDAICSLSNVCYLQHNVFMQMSLLPSHSASYNVEKSSAKRVKLRWKIE
jgi:hypothetical protein